MIYHHHRWWEKRGFRKEYGNAKVRDMSSNWTKAKSCYASNALCPIGLFRNSVISLDKSGTCWTLRLPGIHLTMADRDKVEERDRYLSDIRIEKLNRLPTQTWPECVGKQVCAFIEGKCSEEMECNWRNTKRRSDIREKDSWETGNTAWRKNCDIVETWQAVLNIKCLFA